MKRRLPTAADYAVVAVTPFLIFVMLAALCNFLMLLLYRGGFPARVSWIMFFYTLGVVSVARLAIEQSRNYSIGYALALAAVAMVAMSSFFGSPFASFCLIAAIGYLADWVVRDCTVIDESIDSSDRGLIDSIFFGSASTSKKKSGGTAIVGRSVVYLAMGALPLYGIGQFFIRSGGGSWSAAKRYLALYLFAALSLLVVNSFLGLRRYLRQRGVEMPVNVSASWIGGGLAMVLMVMMITFVLPIPGQWLRQGQWFAFLDNQQLSASSLGWGNEAAKRDDENDRATSSSGDQSPGGSPSGSKPEGRSQQPGGQQSGAKSGQGGKSPGSSKSPNGKLSKDGAKSSGGSQPGGGQAKSKGGTQSSSASKSASSSKSSGGSKSNSQSQSSSGQKSGKGQKSSGASKSASNAKSRSQPKPSGQSKSSNQSRSKSQAKSSSPSENSSKQSAASTRQSPGSKSLNKGGSQDSSNKSNANPKSSGQNPQSSSPQKSPGQSKSSGDMKSDAEASKSGESSSKTPPTSSPSQPNSKSSDLSDGSESQSKEKLESDSSADSEADRSDKARSDDAPRSSNPSEESKSQSSQASSDSNSSDSRSNSPQPSTSFSPSIGLGSLLQFLIFVGLAGFLGWFVFRYWNEISNWFETPDDSSEEFGLDPSRPMAAVIRGRDFSQYRNPMGKVDEATALVITYAALEAWGRRVGTSPREDEPADRYAKRLSQRRPEIQPAARIVADAYNAWVYGNEKPGSNSLDAAKRLWSVMR
ncbi:MAG: DUF4129 domain-containing protein [Planctomycetota bacterium]